MPSSELPLPHGSHCSFKSCLWGWRKQLPWSLGHADSIPALQRVAWTQGECWFRPRKAAGTFVGFRVDAGDLVTLRRRAEKIIQAVSSAPSTGRDLAREAQLDRDLEAIGDNGR